MARKIIVGVLAVLLMPAPSAFAQLSQENNTARYVKWVLTQPDKLNDFKNQFIIGSCYQKGHCGLPKNSLKAMKWYLKAAKQGHAQSQSALGHMYGKGLGVPKNNAEAAKWFRKSAIQGDEVGQYVLGIMYSKGDGVPKNYEEAAKWLRMAAMQGVSQAQAHLGAMYVGGNGVPKNYILAYAWFTIAASNGNKNALEFENLLLRVMTPSQVEKAQAIASGLFNRIKK